MVHRESGVVALWWGLWQSGGLRAGTWVVLVVVVVEVDGRMLDD
jgi:hypothetical protein